jgi:hypothetical protein
MLYLIFLFIISAVIFAGYFVYKTFILEKRVDKIVREIHNHSRNNNPNGANSCHS